MMIAEKIAKLSTPTGRIVLDDDGTIAEGQHDTDDAGATLWQQAEAMSINTGQPVLKCFEMIKDTTQGRELLRRYADEARLRGVRNANVGRRITVTETDLPPARQYEQSSRPDDQIDRLARQYMQQSGQNDYSAAVSEVLRTNPALAAAYRSYCAYRR